jgi:PEP-CTERM motif
MKKTPSKRASSGLIGALAIAGGSSAYGGVVVVTPPPTLAPPTVPLPETQTSMGVSEFWDLNNDGINDFQFSFRQPETAGSLDWQANVFASTGVTFGALGVTFFYVQRFNAGDTIGPSSNVIPTAEQGILASRFAGTNYGNFVAPNSRGFMGFQFTTTAGTFFGYLELKATKAPAGGQPGIQFFSAAYDNTPLTPIVAGAGAVPEPGTLAMLAFGAAGVLAAHQRRKHKQKVG